MPARRFVVAGLWDRIRLHLELRAELGALRARAKTASLEDLVNLVCDTGFPRRRSFFAMQRPREFARFLESVAGDPPRNVLEIGTAAGGSLFLLATVAAPDATIVSVDLPGGPFGGGYEKSRVGFYRKFARRRQRIVPIRGDSHDAIVRERVRSALARRGAVDLAFVDGDHSLSGVARDFEDYWDLVRPGGVMAFHDVNPGETAWGGDVPQFWLRIRSGHDYVEFIDEAPGGGFGIGAIRKAQD